MIASVIIGVLIFSYAGYHIYRFVQKTSKEGACGTCSLKKSCQGGCSTVSAKERQQIIKKNKEHS